MHSVILIIKGLVYEVPTGDSPSLGGQVGDKKTRLLHHSSQMRLIRWETNSQDRVKIRARAWEQSHIYA
jgi:hypothetical protein